MLAGAHVEFIKLQKHGLITISYQELVECLARGSWILSEMVKASSELTFSFYNLAVTSQLRQKMWQEITDKINARNLAVTWKMDEEMKKYENKYYSVSKKGAKYRQESTQTVFN